MRKNVRYFPVFLSARSHFISLPGASEKIDPSILLFNKMFGILFVIEVLTTIKVCAFYWNKILQQKLMFCSDSSPKIVVSFVLFFQSKHNQLRMNQS